MGCTGSQGACLQAVEEAVKENALTRLTALLAETSISVTEIDRKNLLHQAAWLGYPTCVRMLLDTGAAPDVPHRKNGCTPLHLAHFCTVDDSNPGPTITALVKAGASVNNPGGKERNYYCLRDPTRSKVVIWVFFFQTELRVKIYSKSLFRAIGKVLLVKFS